MTITSIPSTLKPMSAWFKREHKIPKQHRPAPAAHFVPMHRGNEIGRNLSPYILWAILKPGEPLREELVPASEGLPESDLLRPSRVEDCKGKRDREPYESTDPERSVTKLFILKNAMPRQFQYYGLIRGQFRRLAKLAKKSRLRRLFIRHLITRNRAAVPEEFYRDPMRQSAPQLEGGVKSKLEQTAQFKNTAGESCPVSALDDGMPNTVMESVADSQLVVIDMEGKALHAYRKKVMKFVKKMHAKCYLGSCEEIQ